MQYKRVKRWGVALTCAALLLAGGCAITINSVNNSEGSTITNEQRATQENDSTQLYNNLTF